MDKPFDTLVYIGRFQPFHNGHLNQLTYALTQADRVIIGLGSANRPPTIKNPWSASDRQTMIVNSLPFDDSSRVKFIRLNDIPESHSDWIVQVRQLVGQFIEPDERVGMVGVKKDASSFYLNFFPEWPLISNPEAVVLDGTDVRKRYFSDQLYGHLVPNGSLLVMDQFAQTERFKYLASAWPKE
jgi:bifunctional NMN adenylyltransferase/nudix hydrolase